MDTIGFDAIGIMTNCSNQSNHLSSFTLTYNRLVVFLLKYRFMLVKVNSIHNNDKTVNITKLDIDDYGSVIPLEDLELKLPSDNDSIVQILENSQYAIISIQENLEENSNIITSADTMTVDELNTEKRRTIEAVEEKKF
jgi:hypothetical protein